MKNKEFTVVNGYFCEQNHLKLREFFLEHEVDMHESINVEFKHWRFLQVDLILNYICAFLNTLGGKIFIGIDDNGIVKGISLK